MNDTAPNLNLARKWRSKSFDQVVGQPLSIRMLKNSLYLDSYFPVYLFSGQRGCGKTTTARVFACAINCEQLSAFQKNPKTSSVPCLQCTSCVAMSAGKHPDFIEIDAASHTGVDNVRSIVDAAAMMPLLGRKKIYLIDEAHMLSKSAFNAFLKILEEPPASVLFILATTDPHKIIDTVKSRCFQLFFPPVDSQNLINHLANVCDTEHINYETAGLQLIVKESEGSVRDALNILEQARFASSSVSKFSVQQVLGHLDDDRLVALATIIVSQKPAALLRYMQEIKVESFSAPFVWRKLVALFRACLWLKYGVEPEDSEFAPEDLKKIVRACSLAQLNNALESLYAQETVFTKTTAQHAVLEMILLSLCKKNDGGNNSGSAPASASTLVADDAPKILDEEQENDEDDEDDKSEDDDTQEEAAYLLSWKRFVAVVETLQDALLTSLFKQAQCKSFDSDSGILLVEFSKELSFFSDWLVSTKMQWQPLLEKSFNATVKLSSVFEGVASKGPVKLPVIERKPMPVKTTNSIQPQTPTRVVQPKTPEQGQKAPVKQQPTYAQNGQWTKKYAVKPLATGSLLDVSDINVWKKTNLILQYFPGSVREVKMGGV